MICSVYFPTCLVDIIPTVTLPVTVFRIILPVFSGISHFRFAILKRKRTLEPWSDDGVSLLIGISNPTLFINYAVHTIHHIIIAIIKMESGIKFALPFIIIGFIEFYGKCQPFIHRQKVECCRHKSRKTRNQPQCFRIKRWIFFSYYFYGIYFSCFADKEL